MYIEPVTGHWNKVLSCLALLHYNRNFCFYVFFVCNFAEFTHHYLQMNAILKTFHHHNRNFAIIVIPCNQFGHQEPAANKTELLNGLAKVRPGNEFKQTFYVTAKSDVNGLCQGCPTRGPRAAMRPAWCLGAAHYSFSLQVVFFCKIVTISSKRVERA